MTAIERIIAYGLIALLPAVGVPWYFEHRGAKECKAEDKAAVTKQEAHNADVVKTDTATNVKIEDTLHAAEIAPIAAPVVRLCYYKANPVPNPTPTAGGSNVAPSVREEPTPGPDIGRPILIQGRQNADGRNNRPAGSYIKNVCLVR